MPAGSQGRVARPAASFALQFLKGSEGKFGSSSLPGRQKAPEFSMNPHFLSDAGGAARADIVLFRGACCHAAVVGGAVPCGGGCVIRTAEGAELPIQKVLVCF